MATNFLESLISEWAPLHPYITVQYCPQCATPETYFFDKWQGPEKPAELKSFEQGHTVKQADIGKELEQL